MKSENMATTLDRGLESRRILESALRTDMKPYLIQKQQGVQPITNNHYPSRMQILPDREGKIVEGVTGQNNGLLFAFSRYPFTITYRPDGGEERSMDNVNAVTLPKNFRYRIHAFSELHLNSVNPNVANAEEAITLPVGYTIGHINKHLRDGRMVVKIAVPAHMYGEKIARGGEIIGEKEEKHIILGPSNQEFSIGGSQSPQDLHVHMELVETYTSYGGMLLYYMHHKKLEAIEVKAGQTLVVPPKVIHKAEIYDTEPTFVTMSGKGSIKEDKFVIPVVEENKEAGADLIKALLRIT
jgi:mannose-6-phosphate isomerase-like protein (cupin superfamily)